MLTRLALTATLLIALSCTGNRAAKDPGPANPALVHNPANHTLRTYSIPPGHEKSLRRLLEKNMYPISVVSDSGAQTQFVRLNPQFTGQGYFVLSAPVTIHEGVEKLLEVVSASKPAQGPRSIRVSYWLVLGWPSAEQTIADNLNDVEAPLKSLAALGTMRFELVERISVVGLNGEEAEARGRVATVQHTAAATGDSVELKLQLATDGGERTAKVETSVATKSGQFAVLGHAGYTPVGAKTSEQQPTLFYIARADTLP